MARRSSPHKPRHGAGRGAPPGRRASAAPPERLRRRRRLAWTILLTVFAVAVIARIGIFGADHTEGDERLYRALVEQLDAGKGYTLQGHPILDEPWVVRAQYDRPLFYHPPGGPGLFWWCHRLFGEAGFALAQLVSFTVFFWSTVVLARLVIGGWSPGAATVVALLAGFTPVVSHVHTHYWLDGPQVAFATAGAALLLLAVRRERIGWAIPAGFMLGWACLVKMSAALVLPGVLALAWAVAPEGSRRRVLAPAAVALAIVALTIAPWLVAEWRQFGTVFPSWAGKPDPELVRTNNYIRFVTEARSPWSYLRLLPQAVSTLVPSLLLLVFLRDDRRGLRVGLALTFWIALIVGVHVGLGHLGYSKLLRYVILVSPATIVLFALVFVEGMRRLRPAPERLRGADGGRSWLYGLLAVAAIGLALEVSLGAQYVLRYPDRDLMVLWPDREIMREMVEEAGLVP